jgi:hypothetical protein
VFIFIVSEISNFLFYKVRILYKRLKFDLKSIFNENVINILRCIGRYNNWINQNPIRKLYKITFIVMWIISNNKYYNNIILLRFGF